MAILQTSMICVITYFSMEAFFYSNQNMLAVVMKSDTYKTTAVLSIIK